MEEPNEEGTDLRYLIFHLMLKVDVLEREQKEFIRERDVLRILNERLRSEAGAIGAF